ncbi:ATP-binding protein [Pseudomonas sp. SWRI12]|uniref:AAA family ATPase n=1 Tax=Pseudomonas zanjanensis TaxID=2745496 RepID=A0A923JJD9_9PSED|nr:AAA family ATPase [Pseudomonas zanjanensis]MBV4493760.1 ATP-binding protein [Pseudomonas zanjanensis]
MILAHIFIAEHKALRRINVPLNGSFRCTFHNSILHLSKPKNTAEYYHDRYCSALIGPNGVGKSSVLDILETLNGTSDSSALIIFFDETEEKYHICPINISPKEIKETTCDKEFVFVTNSAQFLSDHNINFVKINSISSSEDTLNFKKTKHSPNIHNLTIYENVKNNARQRKYFEKLLAYFRDSFNREEFMEEIVFEFVFSSSPITIAKRSIEAIASEKEFIEKWITYEPQFELSDSEISHGAVFQKLIELNFLSISSALAKASNAEEKTLPSILFQFDKTYHVSAIGMSTANRLRKAIKDLEIADWPDFVQNPINQGESEEPFSKDQINFGNLQALLENYLEIFEEIATILFDYCYDGEKLNLKSVKTDYYDAVQDLTGAINRLPSNIANNISWGWRGISSGELARTHIFSESYHYLKSIDSKSNTIFVFDEADLYLHPEWQRTFIQEMLDHLRLIEASRDIKTSQIVICTHSPIIISDFLPDDIASLTKNEDGDIVVTNSYGFGNSIVDIYIKGMHLTSTFGEHARRKIEYLLRKAEQSALTSADRELISNIPNPNTRNFLLNHDKDQ